MAISYRYSSLSRPDLIIADYRFLIHPMQNGIRKLQEVFDRDPTVGSKVMAISNRSSSVARPDLIIAECRFLIHYMPKDIQKLQLQFDRDPTVGSKVMAISNRYSSLGDQTSSSPSIDSSSTPCQRTSENSSNSLTAIQRSDQKLWPFRTVSQTWRDQTSSSPSIHSSSTPCQRTSGNSSYSLIAIQRSQDRKSVV